MKLLTLISCLAITAFLYNCEESKVTEPHSVEFPTDVEERTTVMRSTLGSLSGTEWVLENYVVNQLPAQQRNRATIKFSASSNEGVFHITGRSFVNGYFGEFKLDETEGAVISVSPLGSTFMAGSKEDMSAESIYFENLGKVIMCEVSADDRLYLQFDGNETAIFTKK